MTPPTVEDLAAVDVAARVLARAAKQLGCKLELHVWEDGSGHLVDGQEESFSDAFDLESRGEDDPPSMPSGSLARRLGVAPVGAPAVKLAPFERTVLFRVLDGYAFGPKREQRQTTAALSRLRRKGLMVPGSAMALTPAGRAYLASGVGSAATTKEEKTK